MPGIQIRNPASCVGVTVRAGASAWRGPTSSWCGSSMTWAALIAVRQALPRGNRVEGGIDRPRVNGGDGRIDVGNQGHDV